MVKIRGVLGLFFALFCGAVSAALSEISTAVTLLESPSARSASLSDSLTALTDDVSAMSFNPSSLQTLTSPQVQFLHNQGFLDDSFSTLSLGLPFQKSAIGFAVGYYDAGSFLARDGITEKTVKAKTDLLFQLNGSKMFSVGSFGLGVKYFKSELAEQSKGSAVAIDLGFHKAIRRDINFGSALQNIGSDLKYEEKNHSLPRLARMGIEWKPISTKNHLLILGDAVYHLNEQFWEPTMGVETTSGPLALRAGYRYGSFINNITLGVGLTIKNSRFDYAYGFTDDNINGFHRISLHHKFGRKSQIPEQITRTY